MYKTLDEVPQWKRDAYAKGQYKFSPPPVPTVAWDDLSWINYISHWAAKQK
jgi:hypothetical protein